MQRIELAEAAGNDRMAAGELAPLERLAREATELVRELGSGGTPFDALPHSMQDADFVPSAQLNIELFFRYLAEGDEPPEEATRPLVDRVVGLVRDGMPLTEVLTNYRVGAGFFWAQLLPLLEWQDYDVVPKLGLRLTEYLSLIMARIAIAVAGDVRHPGWDSLERQREIADALLNGRDPSDWAHDPEHPIPAAFLVAAVRLGEPTPGTLTALRGRIAAVPGALLHRDSGGWAALVPMGPEADPDPAGRLKDVLGIDDSQPHPQFWMGVAPAAEHGAIPAVYAEVRVVAEVARCLQLPAVVCRRPDMMFEYAIATADPARQSLGALLDPLRDQPMLAETLDTFIENQFNHNAVARALHIHRNTVTYRLRRIRELTGHDPLQPAGISTLMAARVARRLTAASFHA
ncbi:PucR family transcriptional regulator [Nocardia sp. NPDC020380]|uniref:PucR family transcriptional regulator n=1 Tax=Nocardia sp. NPDC020380 TaxID=3364309 RepID=UPI00378DFCAE